MNPKNGKKEFLCSPQGSDPVKIRHTFISGASSAMGRVARFLILAAVVASAGAALAQTPDTIDQIRVIGNRRIPKETILARMFTHPGDTYDPISIERDFNSLWNTGYFEDLRIEREDSEKGIILDVFVREKPTIRDIIYKGNNSVTNSDILDAFKKDKVGLSVESQYDPTRIQHAENVIKELLAEHGHQFATVKTDVKTVPPASVQVTFNIKEGPVVKVGRITFVGNQHLSAALPAALDEEPEAHRHSVFHHLRRSCFRRRTTPQSSRKTPSGCARPIGTRAMPMPRWNSPRPRFATRAA